MIFFSNTQNFYKIEFVWLGDTIFFTFHTDYSKKIAIGTFASGKETPVLLQNTVDPKLLRNEAGKKDVERASYWTKLKDRSIQQ
jgi:hypothetical protein